ncbi:MAG: TolC family protein, partial [Candidatus Poribacteria bacterium]|nr:TolC family protein [Candidatus Poribacteria bacterium]
VELALARQRIVSVGERLGAANATKLVPSLDIGGELERDGGEWEAGPQMTLPLPVFNRGQGRIAGAESEIRRLQADYYALAVESRSAARRAERRLQVARDKALFYRDDALPLQANILDQTQLQYNAMQIGVTRLLEAKQRQIEAGRLYVEALYDYWSARHAVDQLLSGRMTDAMPVSGDRGVSMPTNEGGH